MVGSRRMGGVRARGSFGLVSRVAMRLLVLCLACLSIVVVPAASEPWLALAPDAQNGADNVTPVDLEAGLAGSLIETPGGASALGVAIGPDARTAYVVDAETHNITPIQ